MTLAPILAPTATALDWQCWWACAMEDFPTFLGGVRIARAIVRDGDDVRGEGAIEFELWPSLLRRARAWQSHKHHEVILKARQLGLSWLAAAYALWTALRQTAAKVLLISQTKVDAEELMAKVQFIYDNLDMPEWLKPSLDKRNTETLTVSDGGTVMCIPSTARGGRGFTATLVIVDEAAHHLHAPANWLAYSPAAFDGGQIIIISTASGTTGFFADRYNGAAAGRNGFDAVFIGALERPDRDMAWMDEKRASYEDMPALFPQEFPLKPNDAFVQLTGLVFPQADVEIHGRTKPPVPWEQCLYRYGSYDLGGGDPTAMGALGVYRENGMLKVHLYGYFYQRFGAPTVSEMHQWLTGWDRPDARMVRIEADPKDAIVEQSLGALGHAMRTADWSRGKGLGVMAQYLEEDWISFPADASELWHEFASYRWLTTVDPQSKERYATATPYDHHGDLIDMIRYGLMGIYRDLLNVRSRVALPEPRW